MRPRFVFHECIRRKDEVADAVKRCMAEFEAIVGVPLDAEGRPMPRPRVFAEHSDREGKLVSFGFKAFRAGASVHHTLSPPHDHDLNPISERIIA